MLIYKTISDEEYESRISNLLYQIEELNDKVVYLKCEINDNLIPEIKELKEENEKLLKQLYNRS